MSQPLKVYTRPGSPGLSRPSPQGCYVKPAIQLPIDDESLPHPGDGKEWEYEAKPCRVIAVAEGRAWIIRGAYYTTVWLTDLRERKPEHEEWCVKESADVVARTYGACTCERRSGEDRRGPGRRCYDPQRRLGDGCGLGRRSGNDRRSK